MNTFGNNSARIRQYHEYADETSKSPEKFPVSEDAQESNSQSYISSASSGANAAYHSDRSTIDNQSTQIPPIDRQLQGNEFASYQNYDSDASDGSIVFSFNSSLIAGVPPTNNYHSPQRLRAHERFPSFDSIQSTGSFQIIPNPHKPQPPNNRLLPYDQRRLQRDPLPPMEQHNNIILPMNPPQMFAGYPQMQPQPHPHPHQMQYFPHLPQPPYPFYVAPHAASPRRETPPRMHQLNTISSLASTARPSQLPPLRPRIPSADSTNGLLRPQRIQRQRTPPHEQPPPPPPPPPPPSQPLCHVRTDSTGSVSSLGSTGSKGPGFSSTDRLNGEIQGFLQSQNCDGAKVIESRKDYMKYLASSERQATAESHDQHRVDTGGIAFGHFNWPPSGYSRPVTIEEFHQRNQVFLQRSGLERDRDQVKYQQQQQQQPPQPHSRRSIQAGTQPNSRGKHQPGLISIDNSNWDDQGGFRTGRSINKLQAIPQDLESLARTHVPRPPPHQLHQSNTCRDEISSSNLLSSSESEQSFQDERSSLLPPSGISTHEYRGHYTDGPEHRPGPKRSHDLLLGSGDDTTFRRGHRKEKSTSHRSDKTKRKKKMSQRNRRRARRDLSGDDSSESPISDSSSVDNRHWRKKRAKMLEKERIKLIDQWKAETRAEAERTRFEVENNRWYKRLGRSVNCHFDAYLNKAWKLLGLFEIFICNLPLTIGAVALAIVTLGVVWFKFAEENMDSCQPVHFHSSQCTFPEFPGCFFCDKSAHMYKLAVHFHFMCSSLAGVLVMAFVLKIILATRIVLDEMSSPTTSSPAGLICMTTVCVFAGQGWIGQVLVSVGAAMHLCLAIWFIYMALAYHIMPDPSWFPNTVGIGLSAVKIWLYYPMTGHLLMAISLSLNFFFFPISLIRVTLNQKISAPVAWIQMSAPAISLYALTIMAQPSFEEEHPDINKFQRVHRMVYLPCMHFLFGLACLGVLFSIQSLTVRWSDLSKREFSPAHTAFCFPTLAHTNAIQAYRAAVNTFGDLPHGSPFKVGLYTYWVIMLTFGTIATLVITAKFFYMLPVWTCIDVADEQEPPAPYETSLSLQRIVTSGESLRQTFVSPAILQANETGALVMLPRTDSGRGRYIRTRQLTALGFEPTMNWNEMNRERDVLLDWVGKNPPRLRSQTLSVPGIHFNYGYGDFGIGNSGVYRDDVERDQSRFIAYQSNRMRAKTSDAHVEPFF